MSSCPVTDPTSGLPLIQWINLLSNKCIYGDLAALSWVSQYISIAVWVTAGTYQSYQLWATKDVNGFSESFLLCWILGACLNALGCVCTGQMAFQVFLAFYFLFSDSILYFQYKYYETRPWLRINHEIEQEQQVLLAKDPTAPEFLEAERHQRASSIYKAPVETTSCIPNTSAASPASSSAPSAASSFSPRSLGYSTFTPGVVLGLAYNASTGHGAPIPADSSAVTSFITKAVSSETSQLLVFLTALRLIVGNTASWASNTLYTVSRFPQIKRNYSRKSCEGVSPALFIATLFGNLSYCITITCEWQTITDPKESLHFFVTEMPFIVGAITTTLADMVIFTQFYIYRDNDGIDYAEIVENSGILGDGRDRITVIEADSAESDVEYSPDMSAKKNKFSSP